MQLLLGRAEELLLERDGEGDGLALEVGQLGVEDVDVQDDALLMWGGVGRCGEVWGDVGGCGEMWGEGDVGR